VDSSRMTSPAVGFAERSATCFPLHVVVYPIAHLASSGRQGAATSPPTTRLASQLPTLGEDRNGYDRPTRKVILIGLFVISLALLAPVVAAKPQTADGKPCPRASQLVTIKRIRSAVPPAKRRFPGHWDVTYVVRGPRGALAGAAARACGQAVVRKSVFVRLHPHGQTCSACDLRSYLVRYRSGRWRVWYLS
jgi:hypothetical protein